MSAAISPEEKYVASDNNKSDSVWPPTSLTQKALFFLDAESPLRKRLLEIIKPDAKFDHLILSGIILNSITMGMTSYHVQLDEEGNPTVEGSTSNQFVEALEFPFLVLFTVESLIKSLALGFYSGPNAYWKSSWSKLDFIVVVVGWFGLIPGVPNLSVLRSFRMLRPLRSVAKMPGLRRLISSFMDSVPQLTNLVGLVCFVLLIFSILGMQLFGGETMHMRCRTTPYPVKMSETCSSVFDDCWEVSKESPVLWGYSSFVFCRERRSFENNTDTCATTLLACMFIHPLTHRLPLHRTGISDQHYDLSGELSLYPRVFP